MNRRFASLLLVCFSLSILVVAFHHHDDGCDHDDCPICVAVLHHSPAEVAAPAIVVYLVFNSFDVFIPSTLDVVTQTFSSTISSRAPPR